MQASYIFAWLLSRYVFKTYFRGRYYNPERVPHGPAILASNHESYFDPFIVGGGLEDEICYLCRESMFKYPVLGACLRSWNAIPVDRDGGGPRGLLAIMDRLNKGHGVMLFPEGTRTATGKLGTARAGIGLLVAKSTAPVIPVRLFGLYRAFNRHLTVPRPHPGVVKYGEPLWFKEYRAEVQTCGKARQKEIYQLIALEIMRAISRLQPCCDISTFAGG